MSLTNNFTLGGISSGGNLDWERSTRHIFSIVFDNDIADTKVFWCVYHVICTVSIVLYERLDECAIRTLHTQAKIHND